MAGKDSPGQRSAPDFSTVIALLSLLVSAVTLVVVYMQTTYLGAQVERMQEQTLVALNDAAFSKAFEMQRVFIDHPELWPYFHHGRDVEPDGPPETIAKLEAVALLRLDYYDLVATIRDVNLLQEEEAAAYEAFMRHGAESSPFMRRIFARHREWYPRLQPFFEAD